uniref:TSA: Wollemia nobilis Ref_Wollemi_Transcript_14320_1605 transcribed RNA sequence n=2 Tax=Wollemia nobilis TaxID=56998 RepID=A0A0C9S6T7_9CONI
MASEISPLVKNSTTPAIQDHPRTPREIKACTSTNNKIINQIFQVTPERGFLPSSDLPLRLPHPEFTAWEETLLDLPKLLLAYDHGEKLREKIKNLPPFPSQLLLSEGGNPHDTWRAMLVLTFMAHAYVWGAPSPPRVLPRVLAVPLCEISASLDMPPVLTYAGYSLLNWRVLDESGGIELGNIVSLNNFYGGLDDEWFRLVHVEIEAKAAKGLKGIEDAVEGVEQEDVDKVHSSLKEMNHVLKEMQQTLSRLGEKCDPHIYYHRVRKFLSGWRGNPAVPNGMIYEGVWDEPKFFYGETGAQSSILPAFDAALGVTHPSGALSDYLQVMRLHMPLPHRLYIQQIENGPSIRSFVTDHISDLGECYDACLTELYGFRSLHMKHASAYITQPGKKALKDEKGTGGTDFIPYLLQNATTTKEHLLNAHEG